MLRRCTCYQVTAQFDSIFLAIGCSYKRNELRRIGTTARRRWAEINQSDEKVQWKWFHGRKSKRHIGRRPLSRATSATARPRDQRLRDFGNLYLLIRDRPMGPSRRETWWFSSSPCFCSSFVSTCPLPFGWPRCFHQWRWRHIRKIVSLERIIGLFRTLNHVKAGYVVYAQWKFQIKMLNGAHVTWKQTKGPILFRNSPKTPTLKNSNS